MYIKGYVGSYASNQSQAILQFIFDTEKKQWIKQEKFLPLQDTKYLALHDQTLMGITKKEKAGIFLYSLKEKTLQECYHEETPSCYITEDERYIYTANYHEGTCCIYKKQPKLELVKQIKIREKAGCHQVLLHGSYLFIPCLLMDQVMVYEKETFAFVKAIPFPKNSGPRHGVFSKKYWYMGSELSNELFLFEWKEDLTFSLVKRIAVGSPTNTLAALRLSEDEQFLYLSLRGSNELIVFDTVKQCIIQRISSGGNHPRDFVLSPDKDFVFVAHKDSGTICAFERDKRNGTLTLCHTLEHMPQAISIVVEQTEELI